MAQNPQKLINFRVFNGSQTLIGMADAELPSLEAMTDTMQGAGIAGEIDVPILGHYGSMELKLSFHTTTKDALALAKPEAHHIELRGSIQHHDPAEGKFGTKALKVVVKAIPKKLDIGKLASASSMDTANEFECSYLKVWLEDKEWIEIDKHNFICVIDGVDYLASVKKDLGGASASGSVIGP